MVMTRLVVCHTHADLLMHKFLGEYLFPKMSERGFNTLFSEVGVRRESTDVYTKSQTQEHLGVVRAKYKEIADYWENELHPMLEKLGYTTKSIKFLNLEGIDYKALLREGSQDAEHLEAYNKRDEMMFKTVFEDHLNSKGTAFVGVGHCQTWHDKGWINDTIEANTKFTFIHTELLNHNQCIRQCTEGTLRYFECINYVEQFFHNKLHLPNTQSVH
ncbi:hypothetical protein MIDIC_130008 [Alphaproteobacteria bacterium]